MRKNALRTLFVVINHLSANAPQPLFILSLWHICKVHLRCQSPCADKCNQMLDFREDARRKGIWSPSIPQRPAFIPTRLLTFLVVLWTALNGTTSISHSN